MDRISLLPDAILHHILSSNGLNTKDVVRTCILSKRWRNVWASMPNLFFRDDDWRNFYEYEHMTVAFPFFVYSVLSLRDKLDVHSFRIWCSDHFNTPGSDHITNWAQHAVKYNVRRLEISLVLGDLFDDYKFPHCIFTCPTLEVLDLSVRGPYADLPSAVRLDRLRELHICRFDSGPILLKALISGCPVLENLHISGCKLQNLDVSSISLKKLTIEGCVVVGARIQISVPSLQSLDICSNDIYGLEVLLENLPSLVEATLQTENFDGDGLGFFGVYDQESLKFIFPRSEDASGEELLEFHAFPILRKLQLCGESMLAKFQTVEHLMQHSPNLKLLMLESTDALIYKVNFTVKLSIVCAHREIDITCKCGVENGRISKLITDFFSSQCGCYWD